MCRVRVCSFVLYVWVRVVRACVRKRVLCVRACVRSVLCVWSSHRHASINLFYSVGCIALPRSVPRVHRQLGERHCEEWPIGGVANTAAKLSEENERTHNYIPLSPIVAAAGTLSIAGELGDIVSEDQSVSQNEVDG